MNQTSVFNQLEETLSQINLAFQNLQRFDRKINFLDRRNAIREQHAQLLKQVFECIQETESARQQLLKQSEVSQTSMKLTEQNEQELVEDDHQQQVIQKRKKSHLLDRFFKCPHADCDKTYSSDVSLSFHVKMKHSQACSKRKATN